MILLNPVTDAGVLTEAWVSFGAIVDQVEVAIELVRTTTVGSPAGTTGTVTKDDPNSAAANWTGLVALTTEPTTYEVLRDLGYVSINKGLLAWAWPLGREPMAAAGGNRIGLRIVNDGAGSMTAVSYRAGLAWEI